MHSGTKISGAAHIAVIGAALLGGTFRSEPLPFEAHDVSVISAEEFAALSAPRTVPETAPAPVLSTPDSEESDAPAPLPQTEDTAPAQAVPDQAIEPDPDPVPETTPEPPVAEADVSQTPPVLAPPEQPDPDLPEDLAESAGQRPSERIAPQPVTPPPPDATPDQEAQPEVTPQDTPAEPRETQEATAPEEASDRIVTEPQDGDDLAPAASTRPRQRPAIPLQTADPEPTVPQPPAETENAVNNALAEALAGENAQPAPDVPIGPPLTGGEKDALRVAVSNCWNVGSLSSDALATTVVVGVSLAQDGRPDAGSIRLLSSSGGSDAAARQAFETARRAIIRCGASGYDLPPEKYAQWRDIEITFNPERMRIK